MIVCIYRSPSGEFELFSSTLTQALELLRSYTRVILVGDFNVRFGTTDARAVRISDLFASYGYIQTNYTATRGNNCLDNMFINFSHEQFTTNVVDTRLSDHLAQILSVTAESVRDSGYERRVVRPMSALGRFNFFKCLAALSWTS